MTNLRPLYCALLLLGALAWTAAPAAAQADAAPIAESALQELQDKLDEAQSSSSSARKKLSLRRVIREAQSLVEEGPEAPNRFVALNVLFKSQQALIGVDDSSSNRRDLLQTAELLAAAPNHYAAERLDADLLVSQARLARQGADLDARSKSLLQLVKRYQDTDVEIKVVRIAMLMALESGDAGLIQQLREVIAQRMPANHDLINFQRDQLAGQVFGAPFVGRFKRSDGKTALFPMDALGKTTALYFWTKEGDGVEQLKEMAKAWKNVEPEKTPDARYRFISFNLDNLPDAGESILREAGLDWPAIHLPGGEDSDIYKTYVRNTPKLLTMTPTGYTAMIMSGSTRVKPGGWERAFGSGLARSWSNARYSSQVQSLLSGEFLIIDPHNHFDPAMPPELKATHPANTADTKPLERSANAVPEDKLRAIQACFTPPATRYTTDPQQLLANYKKADELCQQAIAEHPSAEDLWIVRNRRIVALTGLWKLASKRSYFDAALEQAKQAIEAGYPPGTDTPARLCIAREALRSEDADHAQVIAGFVDAYPGEHKPATAYALAALLAIDVADRPLHEMYRRKSLDHHANHPAAWTATAFLLDRYHRYWMYHPPFTAGWTYGRRMGYFFAIGTPDDADRAFSAQLKTLDGQPVQVPDPSADKWTVIEFVPTAEIGRHGRQVERYGRFAQTRPTDDVDFIVAVCSEDVHAVKAELAEQQAKRRSNSPDAPPTLLVPGGMDSPIVNQLGIVDNNSRPTVMMLRPDGGIALVISDLTGSNANAIQSVIEWHDEQAVDKALERGDLEEAKRLAFAHAPVDQQPPPDAPKHWKPKQISVPHLRARGKVYMAMQEWQKAYDDIHKVYLAVNSKAGYISMRTDDLDEIEEIKAQIAEALGNPAGTQ